MGITFCSIHIYCSESVNLKDFEFQCFSQNWQTLLRSEEFTDPDETKEAAKTISKLVNDPVLWFYEFDDDYIYLKLFSRGKLVSSYSGDGMYRNKNLSQIPQLIAHDDGGSRRLLKILRCQDVDFQVNLLEEYFGVCLLPLSDMLDNERHLLSRRRDDKLYKAYIAEEMALAEKHAVVRVELVQEIDGLLYDADWHHEWFSEKEARSFGYLPCFRKYYYLHYPARITGVSSVPVHFCDGRIYFISHEEMARDGADQPYHSRHTGDNPYYEHEYYPNKIIFSDSGPAAYRGKEMLLPHGMYGLGFDSKERLILWNRKSTFAIVNESLCIIAKKKLKGTIFDIDCDYILTVEEKGIFGKIRVFRICD